LTISCGETAADQDRRRLATADAETARLQHRRVLADAAQFQPGARAEQGRADQRHQRQRQIGQRLLPEQDRAQPGQFGQLAQRQRGQDRDDRRIARPHGELVEECAEPGGEQVDREPGDDLLAAQRHREPGQRQRGGGSAAQPRQHADPGRSAAPGRHIGREGAEQHGSFQPHIVDAGVFGDRLAQRRQQDRRGALQRGREHADHNRLRQQVTPHPGIPQSRSQSARRTG
jgi:hypothetical protein